jgi:hypothetical protein
MLRAYVDIQHGRWSRMIDSKPKIAGSASQHVKSNFLSAFDFLIRMNISARLSHSYRDNGRNVLYTRYFLDRHIQAEECQRRSRELGRE